LLHIETHILLLQDVLYKSAGTKSPTPGREGALDFEVARKTCSQTAFFRHAEPYKIGDLKKTLRSKAHDYRTLQRALLLIGEMLTLRGQNGLADLFCNQDAASFCSALPTEISTFSPFSVTQTNWKKPGMGLVLGLASITRISSNPNFTGPFHP
jgi:hypothetical protein